MARVSRVAQAMRNAYRRDDGSFERMQAAAQKTRAERLAREQTEREATAQRREMQELARKRATNEHLAPIDPEEVLEDELPVTSIETVPVSTPPSRPRISEWLKSSPSRSPRPSMISGRSAPRKLGRP